MAEIDVRRRRRVRRRRGAEEDEEGAMARLHPTVRIEALVAEKQLKSGQGKGHLRARRAQRQISTWQQKLSHGEF